MMKCRKNNYNIASTFTVNEVDRKTQKRFEKRHDPKDINI